MYAESQIPSLIQNYQTDLLGEWVKLQLSVASRKQKSAEGQLRDDSRDFLKCLIEGFRGGSFEDINIPSWAPMRQLLENVSRKRLAENFTPSETAVFVFSFKQPLFSQLRKEFGEQPQVLADEIWLATQLLDKLGLYTIEVFQKGREELITRQQRELIELSTPVLQLWPGVLALPLIGTLDSSRTQTMMQSLLETVVNTGAELAILDITGVPSVDTMVAQHILKTVAAVRLMGAECIVSGIRPQIAQTIVHLGLELGDVITKSTLAGAQSIAFEKLGLKVVRCSRRKAE